MNLANSVNISRVVNATAVGTASINGSVVDMQDFDGVVFSAEFGAITDGTPALKVQGGSASDGSDMADLVGTSTAPALTDDNKLVVVDVYRPFTRYVRPVIVRGGSTGAVVDSALAIQYAPKKKPTTNGTTVAVTSMVVSPAVSAS